MMKLYISGYGKMGKMIEKIIQTRGLEYAGWSEAVTQTDPALAKECVCIDFTTPDAFRANYKFLAENFKAVVVGTTGWGDIKDEVVAYFEKCGTPMIWATNFSVGVNVMFAVTDYMSKLLGQFGGYSPYMIEMHHCHKLDAPSGTAKTLASFVDTNTGYKFTLESVEGHKILSKLSAETAQWDSTNGCWKLKNYSLRSYEGDKEVIKTGRNLDTTLVITVDDFYRRKKTVETLNYIQLNNLIETQQMRGDQMVKYALIEKHTRFALPFAAFILTVIGVSLSSQKRRGGIGMNIGIGIALSFSYILFLRFSQMFVHTDTLPPFVALWLPNIIFAVIAVVLYRMAPK